MYGLGLEASGLGVETCGIGLGIRSCLHITAYIIKPTAKLLSVAIN